VLVEGWVEGEKVNTKQRDDVTVGVEWGGDNEPDYHAADDNVVRWGFALYPVGRIREGGTKWGGTGPWGHGSGTMGWAYAGRPRWVGVRGGGKKWRNRGE